MKTTSVKCPECNAALEAGAGDSEVRCKYCGTLALIQKRTLVLQRPRPLPKRPPEATAALIATERRHFGVLIGIILGFAALCVVPPVVLCNVYNGKPYGPGILADVDGDGRDDLVALMRSGESVHVAAYGVARGEQLWRSEELREATNLGTLCVAGDVVIGGDRSAALAGLDLATGKLRWKVRLDEKVARLCAGEDAASVRVVRKDKKALLLSLADGTRRPAAAAAACTPLRCDRTFSYRAYDLDRAVIKRWSPALPGLRFDKVIRRGEVAIVLGSKTPGTAVPTIAAVRDLAGEAPRVLWRAVIPASSPLSASARAPDPNHVAASAGVVAAAYCFRSACRLTVFSLADGRRRFDVALPEAMRGLWSVRISGGRAIVTSTWRVIAAYDVKDGDQAFTID